MNNKDTKIKNKNIDLLNQQKSQEKINKKTNHNKNREKHARYQKNQWIHTRKV